MINWYKNVITVKLMNILKLRKLRISYNKDAILMILEIKLWSTSLSVNHVEETRFKKINDMIK